MHKYEVIIYWSEDDEIFVAEVPELLGCAAHGASHQETLREADEAIASGWRRPGSSAIRFPPRREDAFSTPVSEEGALGVGEWRRGQQVLTAGAGRASLKL